MNNMSQMRTHYIVMFIIMILSGLLSTMNVWVDKMDDIRFSINDLYMILLMTGWMFLFTGLYYGEISVFLVGLTLVIVNIWCIRNQVFITENQYKMGMIPHHSMAVHMSKKLLERDSSHSDKDIEPHTKEFVRNIITAQENEILFLKK